MSEKFGNYLFLKRRITEVHLGQKLNNILEISVAAYFSIGGLLGTVGPIGKSIAEEVDRVRGMPLSNAATDTELPSERRLLILKLIFTLVSVFLWPIFIYGIIEWPEKKSKGLWFHRMGGHGIIECGDCDHSEKVTSFSHGFNSSHSGFQCQSCGKLSSIKGGGRGSADVYEESLVCVCGGALDRDKAIFCPNCKSGNLSYQILYIS